MEYTEPVSKRKRSGESFKNSRAKRMLDMSLYKNDDNNSTQTDITKNKDDELQCETDANSGIIRTLHNNEGHTVQPADLLKASGSKDNLYFGPSSANYTSAKREHTVRVPSCAKRVSVTIDDSDETDEPFSPDVSEYIPDTDVDSTDSLEDFNFIKSLKQTPTSRATEIKEVNTPDSFHEILTAIQSKYDKSGKINQSDNMNELTPNKLSTIKNIQSNRDFTTLATVNVNRIDNNTAIRNQQQVVLIEQYIPSNHIEHHDMQPQEQIVQDTNKNNQDLSSDTTSTTNCTRTTNNNDENDKLLSQQQSVSPTNDIQSIQSEQPELQTHDVDLHEIRVNSPDFHSAATLARSDHPHNLTASAALSLSDREAITTNTSTNNSNTDEHPPNTDEQPPNTLTRKKIRDEKNWAKNKSRTLKNLGQKYQSCTSNVERREKTMGNPCNCRKKCSERIADTERSCAFKYYWGLGCHTRQWDYILRLVSSKPKRVELVNSSKSRTQTLVYTLPKQDGEYVNVCKRMFLQTFDIHERVVYTALEKNEQKSVKDLRGTHSTRPSKISEMTTKSIMEHINLFPRKESHYLRKQSQREYLDEKLNRSKMYRLYVAWMEENPNYVDIRPATERWYSYIFNTKFNIGFFQPKKDLCGICTLYEQAENERKLQLEPEYVAHIKNKDIVRKIKDEEKVNSDPSTKTVACFDLEKVLSLPQSEVGVFHYKRKYPVYNFTIYNILNKFGYCYVWHAQIAKRGANEIASCLWSFFQSEAEKGIQEVSFYSDNCTGQNRNRFVFALYSYASRVLKLKITHRFLQKGHTQNEGDSMHSCIERFKKNQVLYVPDEMYSVIRNSKVYGQKFQVKEMTQDDFFNVKQLVDTSKNWEKDISGNKVLWTKIKEISVDAAAPAMFHIKYDFEAEETVRLETNLNRIVRRKKQAVTTSENQTTLTRLYDAPLPISQNLYKDLMSLCNDNYIPIHYHAFYKSLRAQTAVQELNLDENSD